MSKAYTEVLSNPSNPRDTRSANVTLLSMPMSKGCAYGEAITGNRTMLIHEHTGWHEGG
jgi:hypothetical protein